MPLIADDLVVAMYIDVRLDRVAAMAAKAATTTIPMVFYAGNDPVKAGLVSNLSHPGGNRNRHTEHAIRSGKRLDLVHQLMPEAVRLGLVGPASIFRHPGGSRGTECGGRSRIEARTPRAGEPIVKSMKFSTRLVRQHSGALLLSGPPTFDSAWMTIITFAQRANAIPTMYYLRQSVCAGGFISYGWHNGNNASSRRLCAPNPERRKARPTCQFSSRPNLSWSSILKTAKALGLEIPPKILALADEVIE